MHDGTIRLVTVICFVRDISHVLSGVERVIEEYISGPDRGSIRDE